MTRWAWNLVGALMYCIGLAIVAQATASPGPDDGVTIAKKAPKTPECPDCGIATVQAEQE